MTSSKRGFTLLETVVAMALASAGLASVYQVYASAARAEQAADQTEYAARLANYLRVMTLEAQTIARACGKNHVLNLEPEDLCALTVEASAMTGVPLAGTSWIPGSENN